MYISPATKLLEEPGELQQTTIILLLKKISYPVTLLASLLAVRQQLLAKLCYSWFQRQQQFLLSAHGFSPF